MIRFQLHRDEDPTGLSGTGIVADGVLFDDQACVIKWRGELTAIAVWPHIDHAIRVHGHGGATRFVFID